MNKWIGLSLGTLVGISHIGMLGLLMSKDSKLPVIDIPTGNYVSLDAEVGEDGYRISYKANDPKTMYITKDIKEKGGFLGLSNETTNIVEEYVMDGSTNQGGSVSNHRSWMDQPPGLTSEQATKINSIRKSEACIEAIGAAKGTGKLVGTSVGAAAAPAVSGIPFIGWVAAGWVAMFGGNQGAEIGGNMAEEMSKDC